MAKSEKKDKLMFYIYDGDSTKEIHIFSAPNPKRAVEKAVVREEDNSIHNYVVRREDRDWGKRYQGRRAVLNPPMIIERAGVRISITKVAEDVKQTSDEHVIFKINRRSTN